MSFFRQEGDDSNLQYDDAGFLYFLASLFSVTAFLLGISLFRTLFSLTLSSEMSKLKTNPAFRPKLNNIRSSKKRKFLNQGFFIKLGVFVLCTFAFMMIYDESRKTENKLKGFDPYDILGVDKGATLREIKKAYRKLAMEFHPDKNRGNPEAQNKFILISKSYECFTDETKKANCFKFGNPDGEGTFRIGIGLPHFFIDVDYQYIVLPLVLTFMLVIVPCFMIRWNNRVKTLDESGISVSSYPFLFKSVGVKPNKFNFAYILSSYT